MRLPYSIQGALFGPILLGLSIVLKLFCPPSVDVGCFADYLAVPIFLPLILVYKLVDPGWVVIHEFWLVLLYWSLVGALVGFIFDLRVKKEAQMTNVE